MHILKEWMYSIRQCLNQLDEYIKRMEVFHFTWPSLNQLDYYKYIKRMDVFHTPILKPTRSLLIYQRNGYILYTHA